MEQFSSPRLVNNVPKDLKINVFEVTLVLKSLLGFRLDYLDYNAIEIPEKQNDVTVEIKCGNSNIVAKLSAPCQSCVCPLKPENSHNNSFWEITGTDPTTTPQKRSIQDTSSNYLPEISKKGVTIAKHLLSIIFDVLQEERLHEGCSIAENDKSPMRKKISLDKRLLHDDLKEYLLPKALQENQKAVKEQETETLEAPKVVVTSSPNELELAGGSPFNITSSSSQSNVDRDINVITQITEARSRLDSALVMLKLNLTQDLVESSILTVTPQKPFNFHNVSAVGMRMKSSPEISKRRQSLPYSNVKSKINSGVKPPAPGGSATKPKTAFTVNMNMKMTQAAKTTYSLARKATTNSARKVEQTTSAPPNKGRVPLTRSLPKLPLVTSLKK